MEVRLVIFPALKTLLRSAYNQQPVHRNIATLIRERAVTGYGQTIDPHIHTPQHHVATIAAQHRLGA
jgi:hypothetical protein